MVRGQLPKAYLRLDPNIDQTHPDNLDAFIRLLCAANRQPRRGWFRSRAVLSSVMGKAVTDRFYARGDVVDTPDGVSIPGWDNWQEGDLDVGERVRRFRAKHALQRVTSTVTDAVTEPLPASEASRRLGVKASRRLGTLASEPRAHEAGDPGEDVDGYDRAIDWLAARKAWPDSPRLQTDLARLVDRKGVDAVIAAMAGVPGAEDAAQFVYGARNALFPLSGANVVAQESREDREAKQRAERRRTLGLEAAQ